MYFCFGRAELTSTSYVYSSLVGDYAGRIVAGAAVDATVVDLGVRDVQVAQHVALWCHRLSHAVVARVPDVLLVQRPGDGRPRRPLHVAHQRHGFVQVHHPLTEGRQDLRCAVWRGE